MDALLSLLSVMLIDLVLAGDNAIVIGALAARLPARQRTVALVFGIVAAIALRLFFSVCAAWLLMVPALGVIGGGLLLWIAWRLWCSVDGDAVPTAFPGSLSAAIVAIAGADLSMSLDNILGVAAAARGHVFALVVGLIASMALMGFAANWIAAQMQRRPWLILLGVAAIALAGAHLILAPIVGLLGRGT